MNKSHHVLSSICFQYAMMMSPWNNPCLTSNPFSGRGSRDGSEWPVPLTTTLEPLVESGPSALLRRQRQHLGRRAWVHSAGCRRLGRHGTSRSPHAAADQGCTADSEDGSSSDNAGTICRQGKASRSSAGLGLEGSYGTGGGKRNS